MRRSGILVASLLLPVIAVAGTAPSNFRIEFELNNPGGAQVSIPVACKKGCEWQQTRIDCPQGETVCHATLHARNPDSYQEVEIPKPVRPIKGSNCLGVALTSVRADAAGASQGASGARITKVLAGSPAAQAGFRSGDVVTAFNTVPVGQASDLYEAARATDAGKPFEASVERQGSRMTVTGIMGVQTTSDTCVVPDSGTLEGPALTPEESKPVPFTLTFDFNPSLDLIAKCLEGCAWDELSLPRGGGPVQTEIPLLIDLDENGLGNVYAQPSK